MKERTFPETILNHSPSPKEADPWHAAELYEVERTIIVNYEIKKKKHMKNFLQCVVVSCLRIIFVNLILMATQFNGLHLDWRVLLFKPDEIENETCECNTDVWTRCENVVLCKSISHILFHELDYIPKQICCLKIIECCLFLQIFCLGDKKMEKLMQPRTSSICFLLVCRYCNSQVNCNITLYYPALPGLYILYSLWRFIYIFLNVCVYFCLFFGVT